MIRRMTKTKRDATFLGLLAACIAAAVGLAPGPLRADSPPGGRQNHPQKVAELTADLGYGSELKHIDAAVPYLARNVLPNDPAWNSTNARWPAVCTLIRQNLRDDAQEAFAGTEAAIVDKAEHVLNDSVSDAQIDGTLAFFKSAPGRHFLELQDSMTEMSVAVGLDSDPGTGSVVTTSTRASGFCSCGCRSCSSASCIRRRPPIGPSTRCTSNRQKARSAARRAGAALRR